MINWKLKGRKKRGRPRRTWKDGIYTATSERGLRNFAIYIYIYNIYIYVCVCVCV
jgi:hypothetical protein